MFTWLCRLRSSAAGRGSDNVRLLCQAAELKGVGRGTGRRGAARVVCRSLLWLSPTPPKFRVSQDQESQGKYRRVHVRLGWQ